MGNTRDVIKKFKELSEDNIDDPVKARANAGDSWIYDHFPQYGKGNTLPRIGFHRVRSTAEFKGIGNNDLAEIGDLQATILVRKGKEYDINDNGNPLPAEDVLEHLKDKVKDLTVNHQSDFRSLADVSYVLPLRSDQVKPENENFILEAITFETRID